MNFGLFFLKKKRGCLQAFLLQLEFDSSLENNRKTRYKIPFLVQIHHVFWVLGTRRIFISVLSLTICVSVVFNNLDSILPNSVLLHSNAKGEHNTSRPEQHYFTNTFTLML